MSRIALISLVLLAACGEPSAPLPPPLTEPGRSCTEDAQCSTELCRDGRCTQLCGSDVECEALDSPFVDRCGTRGVCTEGCTSHRAPHSDDGRACIAREVVACDTLDDSYCDVCDDKCPGQRCEPEVGCAPLSDVGETCHRDDDCRTGNCSTFAGVCRVPLESACDATNCDLCLSDDKGWSFCSRECGTVVDASCPDDRCLGSAAQGRFFCRPGCGGSCPGTCDVSSDGSVQYCDERPGESWRIDEAPREGVATCHSDAACTDGICLSATSCEGSFCDYRRGFCSASCASDAECGEGARCVDLPCAEGDTSCGARCLPACRINDGSSCPRGGDADCRAVRAVGGGTATVCDPRNADGERCALDRDCASLACSSLGRCIPANGAVNGTPCGAPSDCSTDNCQSGFCRGLARRGDRCTSFFDCRVGECVSGVCD